MKKVVFILKIYLQLNFFLSKEKEMQSIIVTTKISAMLSP